VESRTAPLRRPAAPRTRPRRSQAERSSTTRTRLLEATLGALAEFGYAHTTTTLVCRRAGVSQGALFKHFATKTELVSRAAEHLFATLVADYREAFEAAAREEDPIAAATRLLAESFRRPQLQAAFELYLAARTDEPLAASLRPVAERHGANLRRLARELFPEAAARSADFETVVDLVVSALQGSAMGGAALRDEAQEARLLAYLTRLVRTAFTGPSEE
jgi:AcrR family transcriptional regulator